MDPRFRIEHVLGRPACGPAALRAASVELPSRARAVREGRQPSIGIEDAKDLRLGRDRAFARAPAAPRVIERAAGSS